MINTLTEPRKKKHSMISMVRLENMDVVVSIENSCSVTSVGTQQKDETFYFDRF